MPPPPSTVSFCANYYCRVAGGGAKFSVEVKVLFNFVDNIYDTESVPKIFCLMFLIGERKYMAPAVRKFFRRIGAKRCSKNADIFALITSRKIGY